MEEMLKKLEEARKASECGITIYAYGNGENIHYCTAIDKEKMKSNGYWLVSIFECGYRVEA